MKAYADYPFIELGDTEGEEAPVRECEVIGWDGDKYCTVRIGDMSAQVKAGYVYKTPGKCGEVPRIDVKSLPII